MSIDPRSPRVTLRIDYSVSSDMVPRISMWCIENRISYALRFDDFEINLILDTEPAVLAKLKFPIG